MLEAVIQDLIRQQRPYYLPQGSSVKAVAGQYWLVFRHRDADKGSNFLKNIVSLLGFKGLKQVPFISEQQILIFRHYLCLKITTEAVSKGRQPRLAKRYQRRTLRQTVS